MPVTRAFPTSDASPGLLGRIHQLLDEAFDDSFDDDWHHTLGGWHLLITVGDVVIAHASDVPRVPQGRRPPAADRVRRGVVTSRDRQGEGLGSQVMARLGGIVQREHEFGALSTGSHRFYERLGWERWSGPTFVRTGHGLVRTEDDGVMAMPIPRFGSSTGLDLTAPISCEARSGAYW